MATGPWGSAQGALGQAAPQALGGDRAEANMRWRWQRWGRLGGREGGGTYFCGQNTLVPLQHCLQPSPPSSLQLSLLALLPSDPVAWRPPKGDSVTDKSGGGRGGQGVRWCGWGRGVCAIEKVSQDGAGRGSPIYVPAEEMVLHKHVLHPLLQWLLLLLLPLYWQLPVLREAEGEFAKDSQLTFDLHPAGTAQE